MCRALLRFSHLSFMPLEPYPARYARHLPHAGKALSVVILFPHMRVFALRLWGKRYSRIRSLRHEGRLTIRDMLFFHLFSCLPGCFCFLPSHSPVFPCARKISRFARNDDTGKAVFSFSACLKRIPHSLSYRQYPIRPFGAPSPRGEGFWYGESGILISLTFPSGSEWRLGVALLHAS